MKLSIIDYGAGNTKSVQFAFQRLGVNPILTSDHEELRSSEGVIFPGVGNAKHAMEQLKRNGLDKLIPKLQQPVLGVCLGMQLMCESTEEGNVQGLSIFPDQVKKFNVDLKIPQIGWNQLTELKGRLFQGINEGAYFYFVHSFYVPDTSSAIARTEYGRQYTSAMQKNNFYGCQFHPEKSGDVGAQLLKNFLTICE